MNSSKENKNNELVLKAIQNEIEKHNKEKETIQNEMKEMRDPKIIEEATTDIEKIEETIKKYNEDRENFLVFIKEKEENEKTINECKDKIAKIEKNQGRQSLLKDKKECQLAIENEKGKITSNSDGKMSVTKEMQEYQLDLEKINAELKKFDTEIEKYNDKINNSKNRNIEISNSIDAIIDKYHIKLNTEPKAKVESEEEQEEDIDIDEMINDIDEMVEDSEQEPKAKEEPKVEPKAKIEPKVEPKAEQKAKIEPKVEPKAKVEPKVEPKAKVEPKVEPKAKIEPKVEPKVEPKAKIEPKVEQKVEPKAKAEPKVEPKVEPKAKIEPKVEQKIKPNSEQKQQDKGEDVVWAGEWKVLNPNAEFLTDLNYIKVNPLAEKVFYEKPNSKGENIFTGVNFTSDYSKDSINDTVKELKEDYKNILNNDTSSIDAIASAIDPNIVGFLNKNFGDEDAGKECIRKYLNALHGGEKIYNEFPKIIYNLRDIYKSNLDYQQIKNVIKIAKSAKKLNKNLIKIEQDNIIKRSISNLKRIISDSKTKKIEAQSNDKKEKTENKKGIKLRGKEFFEKAMQRAQEKGSKAHFTSKGKISLKDKVKNNITYLKMAGVKIRGYIYGENPLVTNARVNMLKDRIKVPEGTVDEKKALENAENKAKGREQEKEEEQI